MLDVTSANEIADDTRVRGNVVRLAAAQALTGANSAVIFATGSIVGATLAPDMSLATVPLSMYVLGLAAGTLLGYLALAPLHVDTMQAKSWSAIDTRTSTARYNAAHSAGR